MVTVAMTNKGKQKLAETVKIGWGLVEEFTASFSDEEIKTMVQLIGKLENSTRERITAQKVRMKKIKT